MTATCDLSIITLTWNSAATLPDTLRSVLAQTPAPLQHVFVDGGSTDATPALIAEASAAEAERGISSLCVAQTERSGIYGAKNLGVQAATGRYVMFLHSDDWLADGALAAVAPILARESGPDILVARLVWVDHDSGAQLGELGMRSLSSLPWRMPLPFTACFIRRDAFARIGLFDEAYRISGDYDWIYRAHKAGLRFESLDVVTTCMRTGGTGLSNRTKARRETLAIGRQHAATPIVPLAAFAVRWLTRR